jgi:hypothetical protein
LAKKYKGRPFHLLASHVQNADKEKVISFLVENKVDSVADNFSVYSHARHPDINSRGIPYIAIFDHQGKIAYQGHSNSEMDRLIEKLVSAVPGLYLGGDYKSSEVKSLLQEAENGKGLGKVLSKLALLKSAEHSNAEIQEEASDLEEKILNYFNKKKNKALENFRFDPNDSLKKLKRLAKESAGSEYSRNLYADIQSRKENDNFNDAVTVARSFYKLSKKLNKFKACKMHKNNNVIHGDLNCPNCREKNRSRIDSLKKQFENLLATNKNLDINQDILEVLDQLAGKNTINDTPED